MVFCEVSHHGFGAMLAESAIHVLRAIRRCESANLENETFLSLRLSGETVESGLSFREQHRAAYSEVDGLSLLDIIVIQRRDAIIGLVDTLDSDVRGLLRRSGPAFCEIGDLGELIDLSREALSILLRAGNTVFCRAESVFNGYNRRFD